MFFLVLLAKLLKIDNTVFMSDKTNIENEEKPSDNNKPEDWTAEHHKAEPHKTEPWEYLTQNLDMMSDVIPQSKAIGAKLTKLSKGRATGMLPYNEKLLSDKEKGIMASGAVVTLLDQTCGTAGMTAFSEAILPVTLDLRVDYMRPSRKGNPIRCEAHCYKSTKTIAFVRANVYDTEEGDDEADLIATVQSTFSYTKIQPK